MPQSYEEIKVKAKIKYNCDCGGKYVHSHESRHRRTQMHQRYLEEHPDMVEPVKEKKKPAKWIFMF